MGNTPRFSFRWPAPEKANDVSADMKALAEDVDGIIAADFQGTLAARPAAGVRGRYYWATDTKTLARDDGSTWRTVYTDQPWSTWTPTWTPVTGGGVPIGTITVIVSDQEGAWRLVNGKVEIHYRMLVRFTGSGPRFGLRTPAPYPSFSQVHADMASNCYNELARAAVDLNTVSLYPPIYTTWNLGESATYFSFNGNYRAA